MTAQRGRSARSSALLLLMVAASACSGGDPTVVTIVDDEPNEAQSWESFLAESVVHVEGEYYLVEGDIPVHSQAELRAFYDERHGSVEKLAVRVHNNADEVWPNGEQRFLEYCVSTTFPATGFWSRANVVSGMSTAAKRWSQVANIKFTYVPARDSSCFSGSSIPHSRFFKVAPKFVSGAFACAFWPISRDTCVELDGSTIGVDTTQQPAVSAARTLTHELGHVLGLHHEYQRADSGCAGGNSRNLTSYDVFSIMQASNGNCGGKPRETLSELDGVGIRKLYGVPPSWHSPITYPYL